MNQPQQQSSSSFYGLGIAPKILEALDRMKFTIPTPIQHKAIPIAAEGKDISLSSFLQDVIILDGDEMQIKRLFVNLLDNAVRYTNRKGKST